MIKHKIKLILEEMEKVLSEVDEKQVAKLAKEICQAGKVITVGAGRVGMAVRGLSMRLGHLGLNSYTLGDSTLPMLKKGDLLIVCSGSGETQTIYDLLEIAKKHNAKCLLITSNPKSRMGKIADGVVEIKAPSKNRKNNKFTSAQPMTSLNEQCLSIFFDALVLELMDQLNESHETMWARHSVLE